MNPVGEGSTPEEYRDFGERQAPDSPCFQDWALGVADDPEVLALLDALPRAKRQPNLVFAAARWYGAEPGPYASASGLRAVLLSRWDDVRATVLERATQTNEVGRCATLLPVLAGLPGPLALLEVGASAGLDLYPDRYSYRYTRAGSGSDGPEHPDVALDPADGPSSVVLPCDVHGDAPLPDRLPEVAWRGGIDLNPLDVRDDDAMAWLQTLVRPEHDDRRERLAAAVDLVREDPPTLVRGDLVESLPALVEQVPDDATLVVFHSAVLAYLSAEERSRFVALARGLVDDRRGHWVSNEGPRVVPSVAGSASSDPPEDAGFVLGLDGRAVAWTNGHGRALWWLAPVGPGASLRASRPSRHDRRLRW